MRNVSGVLTPYIFHADRRGSIVALSKITNGGVQEGPYAYDTYGKPSDPMGSPYKYTGR